MTAPSRTGALLDTVRERTPLVHCVTNLVATTFSANALLALGASPAMVEDPEEAAELAAVAGALVVNTGTMSRARAEGMHAAARAAHDAGTPWLLDPVAVGALSLRTHVAGELLAHGPTVVRGNASEILALAGEVGGGRGVDATATVDDAADAADELARRHGTVVAVSGVVDRLTDGRTVHHVGGGHPLMGRVTAMGCALGALTAAFLAAARTTDSAREWDPLTAAVAAHAAVGVCGAAAGRTAGGPGSFVPAWLDALAALDGADDAGGADALVDPA
ncbi:hydroxyethylthiazole kinase [Actinomycetospora cinnamomea]|uniref:Hydroxyethylthiazole kinase n=1 Tax=Actinomycetospora cinnamomea TaxID=663609 RepID=A0A2U1FLX5_9PSEU|nr:hydroxyethylthiazole kinase [Actinomycetospora cinnamomea]PVZ13169.1 hydroxyethylthiazole kinase [Actinomycetospora cinnamomea]